MLLISVIAISGSIYAQEDDLLKMLEEEQEPVTNYTIATFKTTRVINGHSIETPSAGVLQFMISHRFGRINGGAYEFFGLDAATIRLGLTYGVTEKLAVGVGRSKTGKTYDGYLKYKLLRQSSGERNFPFSMTLFSSMAINTEKWANPDRKNYFTSRMSYTFQALIARKFTDNLSIQISPTLIHRNLVQTIEDKNDVFAIGIGGRQKLTGSISLNLEYFYVLPDQIVSDLPSGESHHNSFSVGFDIETGGHVFQLHFTNSLGMIEKQFITETSGDWFNGDIQFGFNISRVFTIADKRSNK